MRCTPMAVFAKNLSKENARDLIESDVAMTHPNQIIKDMIYTYCITIAYLLNNPDEPDRAQNAFDMAMQESESFES